MNTLRTAPQCLWHNHEKSWIETSSAKDVGKAFDQPDMLVVESLASQISIGTERLVLTEALPAKASERMRIPYMQGSFSEAFTYGYSLVGHVISGPANWLEARVHLLHPHQRYAAVKISDATRIPDALDTDTATLISNMETAVTALWDALPAVGDRVSVFGYGLIGTLVCHLLRSIPGLELTVVETDAERLSIAKAAGLQVSVQNDSEADLAISTAANSDALQAAIECVRREGTVLEMSWHGSRQVALDLGDSFHYDRKRLISSQVSHLPAHHSHWDFQRRKQLVMRLLSESPPIIAAEQRIAFEDAPAFYAALRQQRPSARHVVIDY